MATSSSSVSSIGLAYSILASLIFGLTPWYIQFLTPLSGTVLFWSRIVFSFLAVAIMIVALGKFSQVKTLFSQPKNLLWLSAATGLACIQWWLFVWAPVNNLTAELSLGYFLLPLALVMTGRLLYKEKLNNLQSIACGLAILAVAHEVYQAGSLSWVSLLVAGGYPLYFVIRRKVETETLICFFYENLLALPLAIYALASNADFVSLLSDHHQLYYLLPVLGILCTMAMLFYTAASKTLSISLFGLLSYLEPTMLFVVAVFVLKQSLTTAEWITYSIIWLATLIISFDSIRIIRSQMQPATA